VVATFYGKHSKYEVVKVEGGIFSSSKYYIHKDGKSYRGPWDSLHDAVEAAKKES
jgi:hypothetical protein